MKYLKCSGVVKREIAGEVFLVHVKQKLADMQNLFVLHGCAEFIWDRIDDASDKAALAGLVVDEFDVSMQVASDDVDRLLQLLADEGLIQAAG